MDEFSLKRINNPNQRLVCPQTHNNQGVCLLAVMNDVTSKGSSSGASHAAGCYTAREVFGTPFWAI